MDEKVLQTLFQAAQRAPSSYNEQPWSFIVGVRGEDTVHGRLLDCLVEANQIWAQYASVLVLSIAQLTMNSSEEINSYAWHDVGLATGFLMLQAQSQGIAVHAMGGFSEEKTRTTFNISDAYVPVAVLAIGYAGNNVRLPESIQVRDQHTRPRKSFTEQFLMAPIFGINNVDK